MLAYDRLGAGPPLLLLHGVGHDRRAWRPLHHLIRSHRTVIAVDLPGHGESPPMGRDSTYDVDGYVHAVARFITELELDTPQVAGNSLGGAVALDLARRGVAESATALARSDFGHQPRHATRSPRCG